MVRELDHDSEGLRFKSRLGLRTESLPFGLGTWMKRNSLCSPSSEWVPGLFKPGKVKATRDRIGPLPSYDEARSICETLTTHIPDSQNWDQL